MKNPHSILMVAVLSVLFLSCDTREVDNSAEETPKITEDTLSKFPAGSTLDSFEEHFNLAEAEFSPHPNQPIGHIQGWYLVPEGDIMVSATLSDEGVMVLDQTPWILTNEELENIPNPDKYKKQNKAEMATPRKPSD